VIKHHSLKTEHGYFIDVKSGSKTFEVRKNDRDFKIGDTLVLVDLITADVIYREVTYILQGGQFGIAPGYVVMGLAPV
jgi:hypothetical protein